MNRFNQKAVALLPACIAVFALAACGSKHESDQQQSLELPAVPVLTRTVRREPRVITEEVVGTVRAKRQATLEPKLSGRIASLPVALGQRVKAGELIARLDTAEIGARLEQAKASLEQAERDWNRTSALFDQQAATRAEYDAAQSRYRVATAMAGEAQAMMNYADIVAPFDGLVTRKWAETGDFATPGKPLVSIEDPSVLQMEAGVPQAIASHVAQDDQINVLVDGIKEPLAGIVREIAPATDPLTRTFQVKVYLPQQAGLNSGKFARLLVPIGESDGLRVPVSAVVQRGQLEIVFVVSDRQAHLHLVKTGKRIGDEWEILSGLDADATVVVEGAAQLTDGQPVEPR
jgi:RND family efflux transporter MFP subunit